MHQSPRFAVPALRWLGVRSEMLGGAALQALQQMTPRDVALGTNLLQTLTDRLPHWAAELQVANTFNLHTYTIRICVNQVMLDDGVKADIEALYTVEGAGALPEVVVRAVRQGNALE